MWLINKYIKRNCIDFSLNLTSNYLLWKKNSSKILEDLRIFEAIFCGFFAGLQLKRLNHMIWSFGPPLVYITCVIHIFLQSMTCSRKYCVSLTAFYFINRHFKLKNNSFLNWASDILSFDLPRETYLNKLWYIQKDFSLPFILSYKIKSALLIFLFGLTFRRETKLVIERIMQER